MEQDDLVPPSTAEAFIGFPPVPWASPTGGTGGCTGVPNFHRCSKPHNVAEQVIPLVLHH